MIKYCKISVVVCCTYPYNFTGLKKYPRKVVKNPKKGLGKKTEINIW